MPSKIKIYPTWWTIPEVIKQTNCLFVFGDNDIESGYGGQAIIRNRSNSIGIPTKKRPGYYPSNYYTDDDYEDNKKKIDKAIEKIITKSTSFDTVYLPKDGFGTGLADLERKAPKTFVYLNKVVADLKNKI